MSTDPSFENPPSESASAEKAEMQYTPGTSTLTNSRILQVLRNHEAQLLRIEGVEGVGVGQNQIGDYAITVYIREAGVKKRLPSSLGGFPVKTEITGVIEPL